MLGALLGNALLVVVFVIFALLAAGAWASISKAVDVERGLRASRASAESFTRARPCTSSCGPSTTTKRIVTDEEARLWAYWYNQAYPPRLLPANISALLDTREVLLQTLEILADAAEDDYSPSQSRGLRTMHALKTARGILSQAHSTEGESS